DPYREAALLDLYPGLDVIETWTYTNPDPKLMLYVETLRAACKPTGQIPLNVVTLLNYPGQLDPTDQWMLMGPGRTTVTSWINLSRAPKIVGYYYSSECQPKETDSYKVPYATSQVIQRLANSVYRPYGPMITQLDVAPRRIAVLSSEAARTHGKSPRLLGGYHNMQIYHFYTVLAMAHLQADVVLDETIERFGLDAYDVLVLPKCDVLTKKVYDEIMRFRDRGGTVIADQYLGPEIPGVIRFDFDFTYRRRVTARAIAENKAYAKWNDQLEPGSAELQTVKGVTALDDQKIMESYASRLKTALRGKVDPAVDCDAPTVLLSTLTKEDLRYLFVINDRRTYDDRVGKYKAVLGKLLPQTTKIALRAGDRRNPVAYDLLDRQRLPVEEADGAFRFTVELTELGGKIIALYPAPLGPPRIDAAGTMTAGLPYPIRVVLNDTEGNPLPGLQPVELTVTSPSSASHDLSGYYCAIRGVLDLQLATAVNDEPGHWKISVLDLTAGGKAEHTFDLATDPQHATPPITIHVVSESSVIGAK
ncbi:MAG: beta-galactosidase trimerization domain-containing protein, partial [Pirellulales bacterium]